MSTRRRPSPAAPRKRRSDHLYDKTVQVRVPQRIYALLVGASAATKGTVSDTVRTVLERTFASWVLPETAPDFDAHTSEAESETAVPPETETETDHGKKLRQ